MRGTVKSPRVDDRSLLEFDAEHGVTTDAMYEGEVDMIDLHEEGDFEGDTGADGKPVKLLQCWRDVISTTKTFYYVSGSL